MNCVKCHKQLDYQERSTYGCRCEDCYSSVPIKQSEPYAIKGNTQYTSDRSASCRRIDRRTNR